MTRTPVMSQSTNRASLRSATMKRPPRNASLLPSSWYPADHRCGPYCAVIATLLPTVPTTRGPRAWPAGAARAGGPNACRHALLGSGDDQALPGAERPPARSPSLRVLLPRCARGAPAAGAGPLPERRWRLRKRTGAGRPAASLLSPRDHGRISGHVGGRGRRSRVAGWWWGALPARLLRREQARLESASRGV